MKILFLCSRTFLVAAVSGRASDADGDFSKIEDLKGRVAEMLEL
jgi:hypothetical protein